MVWNKISTAHLVGLYAGSDLPFPPILHPKDLYWGIFESTLYFEAVSEIVFSCPIACRYNRTLIVPRCFLYCTHKHVLLSFSVQIFYWIINTVTYLGLYIVNDHNHFICIDVYSSFEKMRSDNNKRTNSKFLFISKKYMSTAN